VFRRASRETRHASSAGDQLAGAVRVAPAPGRGVLRPVSITWSNFFVAGITL